jgi:hypothetical protein
MIAGLAGTVAMTLSEKAERLGVVPAALRAIMAEGGMRGPLASTLFLTTRVTTDETMENVAGVGKPPWSTGVCQRIRK